MRASGAAFVPPVLAGGAVSDVDEDALPAFASGPGAVVGEEDGPSLEDLEAQMGGEIIARDRQAGPAPAVRREAGADEEDDDSAPGKTTVLPELDSLVGRLPAEVRETLDELFRARFVSVKKLPKKVFQSAVAKSRSAES